MCEDYRITEQKYHEKTLYYVSDESKDLSDDDYIISTNPSRVTSELIFCGVFEHFMCEQEKLQ